MDLLTDFSSGSRWRNQTKHPSILTDELRGPAAAWSSAETSETKRKGAAEHRFPTTGLPDRPRAPWTSMPRLVREVRLSESMDLLTGFSRLLRWRNLSKDPSILFVELRGPAAAWSWVCDSGAPPSHHPKGEILLEVSRFVNLLLKFSEIVVCLFGLFVCLFGLFGTATCALPHKGFNQRFSA